MEGAKYIMQYGQPHPIAAAGDFHPNGKASGTKL